MYLFKEVKGKSHIEKLQFEVQESHLKTLYIFANMYGGLSATLLPPILAMHFHAALTPSLLPF